MTTIFSKIIAGDIPADIVYRDELVTCFRDVNPVAPVHILIVPNKPLATLNDLTEDDAQLAGHMLLVAARLARDEGILNERKNCMPTARPRGSRCRMPLLRLIWRNPILRLRNLTWNMQK